MLRPCLYNFPLSIRLFSSNPTHLPIITSNSMSPRQKTTASSSRSASRASSTVSTLPVYPGSPPPSYWNPTMSSTSTSAAPPSSGSSSSSRGSSSQHQYPSYPSGKPSPYTGYLSQTSAPVMKIIDLPNVKDQTPPTLRMYQSYSNRPRR